MTATHGIPRAAGDQVGIVGGEPARKLRENGMPVVAWTVRDPEQLALARKHADNIIFEGFTPD